MTSVQKNQQSIPRQVATATFHALQRWDNGREAAPSATASKPVRAIVRSLLFSVFRHRARIDWAIDQLTSRKVSPNDLRNILRIGLCQIFFMDGIASATAVDECVALTRKRFDKKRAGFVNAVLRQALRTYSTELQDQAENLPEHAKLELGQAIFEQWRSLPKNQLEERANILLGEAPLTVRIRDRESTIGNQWPVYLKPLPTFDWAPNCTFYHCENPERLFSGEDLLPGGFYVQDPSTALAPSLLGPGAEETVADLCAAPGGKTLLLADLSAGKANIIAMDRSTRRIHRLHENTKHESGIELLIGDAQKPPFVSAAFDAVLLDVPCSNTGVIRRRPDVRWRFSSESLSRLIELQREILRTAAELIHPGGRLVYSTCSLENDENGGQVRKFLDDHPEFELETEQQIEPSEWHDGGYAAKLCRK
jgi:16S rRNA (cytosine967-C5)-methyltransferase